MPKLDGTGSRGFDSGAGCGFRPCGGAGRDYGYGRGFCRRKLYPKQEEADMLKEDIKELESGLKAVRGRLEEIGG